MKKTKIFSGVLLFVMTTMIINAQITLAAKGGLLTDKKMKGVIVFVSVNQTVYNKTDTKFKTIDESLKNAFITNVNNLPIEKIEQDLIEQNPNLELIPTSEVLEKIKLENQTNNFEMKKISSMQTTSYNVISYVPDNFNNISQIKDISFMGQGDILILKKIYSKKIITEYFNKLPDVDILIFVELSVLENLYVVSEDRNHTYTYIVPYYSGTIGIVAIDKKLKCVGSTFYAYLTKEDATPHKGLFTAKGSWTNSYKSSFKDGRGIEQYKKNKWLGIFTLEDEIETEIEKTNNFFNEFYENLKTTEPAIMRINDWYNPIEEVDEYMPTDKNKTYKIFRSINMKMSWTMQELKDYDLLNSRAFDHIKIK